MKKSIHAFYSAILILGLTSIGSLASANEADEAAVRQTIEDYVHIFYDVNPELGKKVMWEKFNKVGFGKRRDGAYSSPMFMSMEALQKLAANYNKDGHIPEDAPLNVTLFEVSDKTASGKVEAIWGFDYIQLAKFEDEWKIVNILWQSYP